MSVTSPVSGPHTHAKTGVTAVMAWVLLAAAPATLTGLYQFGWPAINLFLLTIGTALVTEAMALYLAGKPMRQLLDGSAVVTGWLLAMTLPPWAPWWIGMIGSAFAILVGKHVFGGLGQNLFNPAMPARVVPLISFPLQMTTWVNPQPKLSP